MKLVPLHDPSQGPLRVAGLMSGSGTNLCKIVDHQRRIQAERGSSPYEMVVIFTDRADSQAVRIGKQYDLPVVVRDLVAYRERRSISRRDLKAREAFDVETVAALSPFRAKAAAYGGYMSIATRPLIDAFLGINVHPADLSVERPDGSRQYTGDHAVRDAIAAGESTLSSTTHIIEPVVDGGRILMISSPMEVSLQAGWDLATPADLAKAETFNQDRLKERGDWVVFPRTVEDLALGRFACDEEGRLYYDGAPIPRGYRLGS